VGQHFSQNQHAQFFKLLDKTSSQGLPEKFGGPGQILNLGPLFFPKNVGEGGREVKKFFPASQKKEVQKHFPDKHQ
jgi:hypothetical protein